MSSLLQFANICETKDKYNLPLIDLAILSDSCQFKKNKYNPKTNKEVLEYMILEYYKLPIVIGSSIYFIRIYCNNIKKYIYIIGRTYGCISKRMNSVNIGFDSKKKIMPIFIIEIHSGEYNLKIENFFILQLKKLKFNTLDIENLFIKDKHNLNSIESYEISYALYNSINKILDLFKQNINYNIWENKNYLINRNNNEYEDNTFPLTRDKYEDIEWDKFHDHIKNGII
jgi:hypothetical protein